LAIGSVGLPCSLASAQIQGTIAQPSIDRWMYPFAGNGSEQQAPIYAALGVPGFDDRDSQFVLAFDTTGAVPPRRGPNAYRVNSLTLRVTTNNAPRFAYDPTFDSVFASVPATDPQFLADVDTGKPIEVFAAGFRNGLGATTFAENSLFTFGHPQVEGVRSAYAARLAPDGSVAGDLSNQVANKIEQGGLGVGVASGVTPGELVPQGTTFAFTIDLNQPGAQRYFRQGLSDGRIFLVVSSLHPAAGGPGGGTGDPQYPSFYTKENPLAPLADVEPTLEFDVAVGALIDFNNDGVFPDFADVVAFLEVFAGGACDTCSSIDANGDGVFPDLEDVTYFFFVFGGG
jgi:hypothetical protein